MPSTPKFRRARRAALVESLENRQLLAADLTGAFLGAFPSSLKLSGLNHVTVRVGNVGTSPAVGSVTVALYASSDATLDSGDTALLPTVTRNIRIAKDGGVNIPMKFNSPTGLADGNYYLLADITPSSSVGDGNPANNVVASSATTSIRAAFVDLTGSILSNVGGSITIARHVKPISVKVAVTNNGNVPAKGSLLVDLYAATHTTLNSTDTLLVSKSVGKVTIGAGKTKPLSIRITPGAADPSGTFYLLADVNPGGGIAESNSANNVAASGGTFMVSNPAIPAGPFVAGPLMSSVTSVFVNQPQQTEFTIQIGRAGPGTAVQVDEFDSSGNNLGLIATLVDDGSSASGDAVANDGIYSAMATLSSTAAGTRYFAAVVTDPQLSAAKQSSTITVVATPPPLPALVGTLNTDIDTVVVGHTELAHFNVQLSNFTSSTAVEVDEFDAQGNNLGKLVDLLDNGSSIAGDRTAGDGIYSGVSTIAFSDPGTRYFAAVVSDPALTSPIDSSTLSIAGQNAPSQSALAADITDNNSLNQIAGNIINGGGSEAAALAAVQSALASDANVKPGTVATTATSVEWQTVDGSWQGISADFLTSSLNATLGGAAPSAASSAVQAPTSPPMQASADPTLNVLLLSPFASSLSTFDPTNAISGEFSAANYTVTTHTDAAVTFDDFKNLGQYDAVNLYGHGTQLANGGEGIYTSIASSAATSFANVWDLLNNRLVIMNGYYVVTPNFITAYAGAMNGTIVEFEACSSLHDTAMGDAFLNLGAGAYIGYSQTVKAGFAAGKATLTWQTLLGSTNNTVGDIPGINTDHDTNTPPAVFTEDGPLTATLPQPNLLKDNNVLVEYDWPQNVSDLDSNTTFLGSSVGYNLGNSSPYLNWSGDNTGAGGSETTIVDIYQAWVDQQWANSTTITVGADWYTPAGGSGPAFITIALQNKTTGKLKYLTNEKVISPGQETDGAQTVVGAIDVVLGGSASNPTVKISLT